MKAADLAALKGLFEALQPPEDQSTETLCEEWLAADHMVRLLDHRKAALRVELLRRAREDGASTEKGGSKLRLDAADATVVRKVQGGPSYPLDPTRALLATKSIPPTLPCPLFVTRVKEEILVNPDAMRLLEEAGYFTPDEVAAIRKPPIEALEIVPDPSLADRLETILPLLPGMVRKGQRVGPE